MIIIIIIDYLRYIKNLYDVQCEQETKTDREGKKGNKGKKREKYSWMKKNACTYIYIYIYIEGKGDQNTKIDREAQICSKYREKENNTNIYIYIYIYIERERETKTCTPYYRPKVTKSFLLLFCNKDFFPKILFILVSFSCHVFKNIYCNFNPDGIWRFGIFKLPFLLFNATWREPFDSSYEWLNKHSNLGSK